MTTLLIYVFNDSTTCASARIRNKHFTFRYGRILSKCKVGWILVRKHIVASHKVFQVLQKDIVIIQNVSMRLLGVILTVLKTLFARNRTEQQSPGNVTLDNSHILLNSHNYMLHHWLWQMDNLPIMLNLHNFLCIFVRISWASLYSGRFGIIRAWFTEIYLPVFW